MTNLVVSARQEEPWSRALRLGLTKYGETPLFSQLAREFEAIGTSLTKTAPRPPKKKAAKKVAR